MARAFESVLKTYATADRRVLGAFRIYFGAVLLCDLIRRWEHLIELYTDAGLLPVDLLRAHPQAPYQASLYVLARTPAEAHGAFALTAAVYVAYIIGFHTRVVQWLVLLCATGLDARNLLVENGGTVVVNLLAAWTVLLPLGDRYSFDARWRARGHEVNDSFRSIAVVGVLVQAVVIYTLNAVHKRGTTWKNGEAIHYVLWQNRVATPFAAWLRLHEPPWLSPILTTATVVCEVLIPVLLLLPWRRPLARTGAFLLAVGLHGSIASVMRLGPFSYAMMALVMLTIPTEAADFVERRVLRVQRSPSGNDGLAARNGNPGLRPLQRALLVAREIAGALLLATVLSRLFVDDPVLRRLGARQPSLLEAMTLALRLPQRWTMYAPDVPRHDGMLVVDAMTDTGRRIDPFTGESPDYEILVGPVPHSEIMTNHLLGLFTEAGRPYQPGLVSYLSRWHHLSGRAATDRIQWFQVTWVGQTSPPMGSLLPMERTRRVILSQP